MDITVCILIEYKSLLSFGIMVVARELCFHSHLESRLKIKIKESNILYECSVSLNKYVYNDVNRLHKNIRVSAVCHLLNSLGLGLGLGLGL